MSLWKEFLRPQSIQEALEALTSSPTPAIPIAGGTDLMLDLQQGNHPPVHTLVDLTGIKEINIIEIREGFIFIGAGVPHNRIVESKIVQENAQALIEACGLIGGPQVRNMATLGGNVAHALPAADGTIGLLCLDAKAEIASLELNSPSFEKIKTRRIPLQEIFAGPGKSHLGHQELLTGFYIPLKKANQGSAFYRVMRAQGIALPILNLAACLECSPDGKTIAAARISAGPAGPIPFRARQTESLLQGMLFGQEAIASAKLSLLSEAVFRTSPARATAEYRKDLVVVLLEKALQTAWERTKTS